MKSHENSPLNPLKSHWIPLFINPTIHPIKSPLNPVKSPFSYGFLRESLKNDSKSACFFFPRPEDGALHMAAVRNFLSTMKPLGSKTRVNGDFMVIP